MTADSPIIVALDYAEPEAALAMAARLPIHAQPQFKRPAEGHPPRTKDHGGV